MKRSIKIVIKQILNNEIMLVDENKYIEVKVWSAKFTAYDAKKLVLQGISTLLCHGNLTKGAKKILDEAGIQYRENISSDELNVDKF